MGQEEVNRGGVQRKSIRDHRFGQNRRGSGKRMMVMGMTVLALDPFMTEEKRNGWGFSRQPRGILAEADYINVHTPLTPETKVY